MPDDVRATYDTVACRYEDRFLDELAHKPRDRALLGAFAAHVGDPVVDVEAVKPRALGDGVVQA